MKDFEREFEEFCKTPNVESGKARSYVKAIKYLCDYMGIYEMSDENIRKLLLIEDSIKDKNSKFYNDLNIFLSGRKQTSYLKKGFISAALKCLFKYNAKK